MASLLPGINVILRKTSTPPNPQDLASIAHVIGPCSAGPLNTPTTLTTFADLAQFGFGPGIEQAADILNVAGGPVYFTRSAISTPSVLSSVTKTLGNPVGAPVTAFGSVIVPGVDFNGDVLVTAKALGVTLQVVDPGATHASTTFVVTGSAIVATLKHDTMAITETGTGLAAAIAAAPTVAALISATAIGTGASLAGVLTTTTLDDGALTLTSLMLGVSVVIVRSGTNTTLSSTLVAGVITLNLATNANGETTTTGSLAYANLLALAGANPGVFSVSLVGAGTKLLGAKASTPLPFGSSGTGTVAGPANDVYNFTLKIVRGGAIGGLTPVTVQWTIDGVIYTSEQIIPNSGIYLIKDLVLDTGVTFTFVGTFDAGDTFTFTSTAPETTQIDFLTALTAVFADTQRPCGFVTCTSSFDKVFTTAVDAQLQAILQARFVAGLFNTRDIAEGVPGETEDQWMTALELDFLGFVSTSGLARMCAGAISHQSTYTDRIYRRPMVFAAASRRASIPVHEDLGKVASGVLRNVLAIYHDEAKKYGLNPARFITTRTYDIRPGQLYITKGNTLADSTDVAYNLLEYSDLALSVGRIAKDASFQYVLSSMQAIPIPDGTGAPAGALAISEAAKIKSTVEAAIKLFLFRPKTDGNVSASLQKDYVNVLRNYNYLATKEIREEVTVTPLGLNQTITIGVNLNIPA